MKIFQKLMILSILCIIISGCSTVMDWVKDGEGNYTSTGAPITICPECGSKPIRSDLIFTDQNGHMWICDTEKK